MPHWWNCANSWLELIIEDYVKTAETSSDSVEPVVVGELCLALQDDCYYQAEVVSMSPDHDSVAMSSCCMMVSVWQ